MSASKWKPDNAFAATLLIGIASIVYASTASATTDINGCTGSLAACKASTLRLDAPDNTSGPKDTELWPGADKAIDSIVSDAAKRAQAKAMAGLVINDSRDSFRTTLGGKYFYLTTNTYNVWPKGVPAKGPSAKDKGYCEFYIYDSNLKFVSSRVAKVGVGPRLTMCNDVAGVAGVAFHGKPALMAIVQYFYTGGPVASSAAELGSSWIRTTVLLPLVKEPDGKWAFTQDTSCFAPTNQIKTLAQATRYLEANCR